MIPNSDFGVNGVNFISTPGQTKGPEGGAGDIGVEVYNVTIRSEDSEKLKQFIDQRGLEISFVLDPVAGVAKLRIVDPISGRTVTEIPSQSLLEETARKIALAPARGV